MSFSEVKIPRGAAGRRGSTPRPRGRPSAQRPAPRGRSVGLGRPLLAARGKAAGARQPALRSPAPRVPMTRRAPPRGRRSDGAGACAVRRLRDRPSAMADEELAALRQQRLAELQAKHGDSSADPSQQEAKQREAEIRNTILAQVLDQAARARLSNLALVKPDKAKAVENYLIQMARFGQLPGKVSEQGLIEILEKVSQQTEKKTTVKFNRRKVLDSDEEDDY
uniref:Programmed cell death protein 5 n=3 Tax=Phasianinae TaxID=9072 RepID=A0A669QWA6_PHACC